MTEQLAIPEPDKVRAAVVDGRIDAILREEANALEIRGKRGAELGRLLLEVQTGKLFVALEFENYTDWLKAKKDKFGLEYPWLYAYKSAAERLLPYLKDETFDEIGISKANELAKMVKITGRKPDEELVEKAKNKDTTVKELRAEIAGRLSLPEDKKGTWVDLDGFYATAEEREVIARAIVAAKRTDPVIPKEWPAWMQRKEAWLRMAMSYLAEFEAEARQKEVA